jgi:hypothetical protein
MSPSAFDLFPEELTEQIISLCVTAPFDPPPPRPAWLQEAVTRGSRSSSEIRTRLAPLLVSKEFHRIAIPHYHSTVHITSPEQAAAFLRTLQTQKHLVGSYVRRFVSSGIFPMLGEILQNCKGIRVIDFYLDSSARSGALDSATKDFCDALDALQAVRHISLRKSPHTYLTLPRVRYVLTRLAGTVAKWTSLESANVAFRMSDNSPEALLALAYPYLSQPLVSLPLSLPGSASSSSNHPSSSVARTDPISLLASALSKSPTLHTFATHVPNVWNETILCVSDSPSLKKIILGDPRTGVMITGMFMAEAKKHTRLVELIKAGTSMVRMRAQTLGNSGNPNMPTVAPYAADTATRFSNCAKVDS